MLGFQMLDLQMLDLQMLGFQILAFQMPASILGSQMLGLRILKIDDVRLGINIDLILAKVPLRCLASEVSARQPAKILTCS